MNEAVLLAELEDLIRNEPGLDRFESYESDVVDWYARVKAIAPFVHGSYRADIGASIMTSRTGLATVDGYFFLITALKGAAYSMRLLSSEPLNVSLDKGTAHAYFDAIRKIVQSAKTKLTFVDPFFNEEVISSFFPFVTDSCKVIKILTRDNADTIRPSVEKYIQQTSKKCELRRYKIHDRMLFVDSEGCYLSGTSFKEGSHNHPTSIVQLLDFKALRDQYNQLWESAEAVI